MILFILSTDNIIKLINYNILVHIIVFTMNKVLIASMLLLATANCFIVPHPFAQGKTVPKYRLNYTASAEVKIYKI